MEACEACAALDGEAAAVEPHPALNGGAVHVDANGTTERYACCDCGTLWERVLPRDMQMRRAQSWTVLNLRPAVPRRFVEVAAHFGHR